jgi:hypothetical protein
MALSLALAAPAVAVAQEASLLSFDRLSIAGGVDYAWYEASGNEPVPSFGKEWEVTLVGAYSLTPQFHLTGSSAYGLDNKFFRTRLGVRVSLWQGGS